VEALVSLELSELKYLESRLQILRQYFLHQGREIVTSVFTMDERILGRVLLAFAKKYLDQENGEDPSFYDENVREFERTL